MKKKISMFLCIVMVLSTILGNAQAFEVRAAETVYGQGLNQTSTGATTTTFTEFPRTMEVTFRKPNKSSRSIIFGNCDGMTRDFINLEVDTSGAVYFNCNVNGVRHMFSFTEDKIGTIYNNDLVRVTIVIEDEEMHCYINGDLKQTRTVSNWNEGKGNKPISTFLSDVSKASLPSIYAIGNDPRIASGNYFVGTIYDLSLWSDARTAEEIACSHIKSLDKEDENLIAAYDFTAEENQNQDLSGNDYNLSTTPTIGISETPVFGAHTTSSTKSGLSFEDKTRYMTENTLNEEPYTMSSWVKLPSDFEGRGGVVFGNYKDSKTPCVSFEINTAKVSEETVYGVPRFYHINSAGEVTNLHFTSVDIRADEWVHLAYTIDGANNTVSCYLNGVLKETKEAEFDIDLASVDSPYLLGGDLREATYNDMTNVQYFKGSILEVALYKEALAETELRELYVNGVDSTSQNILSYYQLQNAEQGKDISDLTGNGNNIDAEVRYFSEKETVKDYAYSFAVVGDTQIVTENDVTKQQNNLSKIYDWILANKESKNIQYVFGLGDITDNNNVAEWELATTQIQRLDGEIPYSVVRGNHELVGFQDSSNTDYFTQYLGTENYRNQFANGGFYEETNVSNSWRTFTVGEVNYLMLAFDFGPSDDVLNWADKIISAHPEHQVIITTHAYLFRDGTTLDSKDACPPVGNGGSNNGDHIWEKLVSKHENIVLLMSGHDPSDNIVMSQDEGEHGNVVTSLLIDPQYVDIHDGSTGMVAMLYFTEDGKHVQVEYYSTVKGQYFKKVNQFDFSVKIDACERVVQPYTAAQAAEYIAGDNKYPTLTDYIFAGWYTDEACDETCLYAENTPGETVYALFVPDDVLSVKAQISSSMTDEDVSNDSQASIRFVTTVDSLLYSQVGFELSYVGTDNRTYKATSVSDTVHKRLYTIDGNSKVWCKTPASTFCGLSKYFRACTIQNLLTDFYNTKFTVKPYWITADGDKVYGKSVTKSIADGCVRDEIWVSSGETSGEAPYYGSYEHPFSSLNCALDYVSDGGTVRVKDTLEVADGATWTKHGKHLTITGDDKDSDKEKIQFGSTDVCIKDHVTFDDVALHLASEGNANGLNRILAEGNELVINPSVEVTTASKTLQLLGGSSSEAVDSTNLKVYSGTYSAIYGGGSSGDVLGDTNVVVGEGVNLKADYTSHDATNVLYGAGWKGTVHGNTNITVESGANFNYIYGAGDHADSKVLGSTNIKFAGNAMSIYGGSNSGTNADTNILMTNGYVQQIFGGCKSNSMTGNTNIQVTGGTVLRRIYGGCYRDMNILGVWETNTYSVTGHTNVKIGEKATLLFDYSYLGEKPDNALYSISRNSEPYENEWGTFIFNESEYTNEYKEKLGQHGDSHKNKFSSQSYHYLVTTNGNTADNTNGKVSPAGDCIKIEPNSGYVATVTYTNVDDVTKKVHYTADEISYYPLPALTSKNDMVEIYVEFGTTPQTEFSGYEAKIGSSYYLTEEEANIAAEKLEDATVVTREYGTGYVPVKGQQVKTTSSYTTFPRTIEVTFNKNSKATRQVLFGNCGGSSGDYFNLEAPINENIIYLNLCLGGEAFQHSFNKVSVPTNEISRVTVVIEDKDVKCYVNGVEAQTRTTTNGSNDSKTMSKLWEQVPKANLSNLYAVGSDLRADYYFDGTIYDVALWSDVRTAEEVATSSIGNIDTDTYKDNLIAAYDFRNSYNPVYETPSFHTDLSGNEYDLSGTLNIGTSTTPELGIYSSVLNEKGTAFTGETLNKKPLNTNPYSISAWIKLDKSVSRGGVIFGNYIKGGTTCTNFEIHDDGKPRFYHINSAGEASDLKFNVDIRSGKWVHLAFGICGNQVTCYVDGVKVDTMPAQYSLELEKVDSSTYVLGGDLRSGNPQNFKGRMLELAVYKDSLTPSEIKKLYNAGNSAISKNPLASYEFLTAE